MVLPPSKIRTWSSSVTFTITHDCPWHCRYCNFRTDDEGLLSEDQIVGILADAHQQGAREALLISGEMPGRTSQQRDQLQEKGFSDIWDFVTDLARRCLAQGLLPHGNYGALNEKTLARLRPWHVSMGLMLENIVDMPDVAPEKSARLRLRTLEAAGRLRIPFTSGILIGLGETEDSRLRSLDALAAIHQRYGHLQEILIQNYMPGPVSNTNIIAPRPTLDDYVRLIGHWRQICPDVAIQIPPNLNPFWQELLPLIDDLGGISMRRDEVNPSHRWRPAGHYETAARKHGLELRERLAVYPQYITPQWLDASFLQTVKSPTH